MLARAPLRFARRPVVLVRRRPWRRLVAVVRGLARRGAENIGMPVLADLLEIESEGDQWGAEV